MPHKLGAGAQQAQRGEDPQLSRHNATYDFSLVLYRRTISSLRPLGLLVGLENLLDLAAIRGGIEP
jgi:hypothetical protein